VTRAHRSRSLVPFLWLLPLGLASCAGSPARSADARTFRGLTLEEWQAIPWTGGGRIRDGSGEIRFQRDPIEAVEALAEFACDSRPALASLRGLARDRDEDVREEAAAALVALAFSAEPNRDEALHVVLALAHDADGAVAASALVQLVGHLDDAPEDWPRLGAGNEEGLRERIEPLVLAPRKDCLEAGLEAMPVLARRAGTALDRCAAILSQPAERFRCPDAADALADFASDLVDPRRTAAGLEPLGLAAARTAAALAPRDPDVLATLAVVLARTDAASEARATARHAIEAASAAGWSVDGTRRLRSRLVEILDE